LETFTNQSMKISRFHADNFGIDEGPSINEPDIASEDQLFIGGNRSGKSLTYYSIMYGLFGSGALDEISPGRSSEVKIHFDNSDLVDRTGRPHEYAHNGDSVAPGDAVPEYVGSNTLLKYQFLTLEEDLPLERVSGENLVEDIRRALSSNLQQTIEYHRKAVEHCNRLIDETVGGAQGPSLEELKDERNDLHISSDQNRIEKIERLISLADSGGLAEINERLQREDELSQELDELYDRKRDLEQNHIPPLSRKLREEKRYTDEVTEILVDAVTEMNCPVCDRIVDSETAKSRLDPRGGKKCPHCAQDAGVSVEAVEKRLSKKVEAADDTVDKLEQELEEARTELDEVKGRISEIQEQDSSLEEVDGFIRTALKQADHDLEKTVEYAQEELEKYQERLEKEKQKETELDEEIAKCEEMKAELETSVSHAQERIEQLSKQAFSEKIQQFEENWSENYSDMVPDLAVEVDLDEEGSITLPGPESQGERTYGEISGGERWLLNIAFGYTLAEAAQDDETAHNWEVLVMDQPFAEVSQETQEQALNYLYDSDIQSVIMTSDELVQSPFRSQQVHSLSRIDIDQARLDDFTNG